MATPSRHISRHSWAANHGMVAGTKLMRRRHAGLGVHFLLGDEVEEDFLERRLAADAAAQFGERAFGDEPAVIDDADAFGHAFGHFENVGGHDDGDALLDLFEQHLLDLPGGAGIEAGQRFVENDELGIVHERAGEGDLLQHALGEAAAALVRVRGEAEPADQFGGAGLRLARIDLPEAGDEFEILVWGQAVVDHRLVGDPGDDRLGLQRILAGVDAEHRDGAGFGLQQAGDHAEDGGLAGAVGAEQRVELAAFDAQLQVFDDRAVEALGHPLDLEGEGGVGHGARFSGWSREAARSGQVLRRS